MTGNEPVGHLLAAVTVKVVVGRDDPLLQGCRHHQRFKGRTGLVGVRQGLVSPLEVEGVADRLVVLVAVLAVLLGQGFQLIQQFLVEDAGIAVGVKVGAAGHTQHRSGGGVQGDGEATLFHVVGLDALLQGLLQHGLDGGINGQVEVAAVLGVDVLLIGGEHLGAGSRLGSDHSSGGPGQNILVQGLHTLGAHLHAAAVLGIGHEAQDMGAHRGVGVIALAGGLEVEHGREFVLLNKLPHRGGLLLLQLVGQRLIGGVGVLNALAQPVLVESQQVHQSVHNQVPLVLDGLLVLLLLQVAVIVLIAALVHRNHHVPGGEDQLIDGAGPGQGTALGVVDGTPSGVDRHVQGLLIGRPLLPLVVLEDLQLHQLGHQGHKGHHSHHRQQHHRAAEETTVSLSRGAA